MKYYKTDSRKISFREYWHLAPKSFLLAWLNKIKGKQMKLARGIPEPQPFQSRIIEANSIPPEILGQLNAHIRDLQGLGFDRFWFCSNRASLVGAVAYMVVGLHSSRQIIARIIYAWHKARQRVVTDLSSRFHDGIILGTTNNDLYFNPLRNFIIQRKVGARAEYLFEWHQKKIAELSQTKTPQTFAGLEGVAAFEDELLRQIHDDRIKRGIWVEMTDAEVTTLREEPPKAHLVLPS